MDPRALLTAAELLELGCQELVTRLLLLLLLFLG